MPCPRPASPCALVTLANGPIAHVQHCPQCGVVSVHLGATTVRLEPAAYEALWGTLGQALRVLRGVAEPPEVAPRITAAGGKA